MENQSERPDGAVAHRHVEGAEAVEFEFEGLDDIEPDYAKSAVEVLAAGGRRGEFLGLEDVGRKQLQRHWLHPRGEDIWSPEKIARIEATFLAEGQLAPLQAVMDEDGGGNYHVFIDGGLLHAVEALEYDGKLRVEVWHLNDAQVAAAIFRAETLNQKLSSYERSVVLRAYVDAHDGVQRACFEALGFESEAGLSRALAPVRLHPEILKAIEDKTGIGVADAAKVVTLCGDPQKRGLILAWIDANPLAARTMKAGRQIPFRPFSSAAFRSRKARAMEKRCAGSDTIPTSSRASFARIRLMCRHRRRARKRPRLRSATRTRCGIRCIGAT